MIKNGLKKFLLTGLNDNLLKNVEIGAEA